MADYVKQTIESTKQTIAQNFTGDSNSLVPEHQRFSLEEVPDLTNKVAVVTGGSEGVGFGCTHTLLNKNIKKVFILTVSKEVIDGATKSIEEEMGADKASRVEWMQLDLSDWTAAARVADEITKKTDRLDILINNAGRGIMTYQLASNGVDLHMATNHFGPVVLTSHLMPLLKKTADAGNTVRIVNLGSNAHQNAPKDTKFESLEELNQDLGPNGQYGRSKLAAILYAKYLARHLTSQNKNILANASHPGFVQTRQSVEHIHEPYPLAGYGVSHVLAPLKKDQFEGAVSTMFAATKTEKSGQYICPPAVPEQGSELANNDQLGEQLMKLTKQLVEEKTGATGKSCPLQFY